MVDGSVAHFCSRIGGMELGVADDRFFKVRCCKSGSWVASQVGTRIGVRDARKAEE